MAEHVHPRALQRAQHAIGHLRLILREMRVDRGDDDVELRRGSRRPDRAAVGEDVALDAGEQRQPLETAVERPDARRVFERARSSRPLAIASALLWSVMAMYRGRDGAPRRPWPRASSLPSRRGRVHVQIAAQIAARDERGQGARDGGLDFAAVLAQLGLDPRHAERAVDAFLGVAGDSCSSASTRNRPYSFNFRPALNRAVAQRDVVGLGAGEVLHGGAAALARHQPQVGLIAAAQPDARLRVALAEHALDARVGDEHVHQRLGRRRRRGCRCRRRSRSRGAGCRPE